MKNTPEPPPASLRLKIDAEALAANWRALDRLSGAARAGAAIKADGYGLGARLVAPVLRQAGARQFFVAHWAEVPPLLDLLPAAEISVLHGPLTAQDAAFARATGVRPVLNSLHQVRLWLESGGGACDLMVDSGMNRLGLAAADLADPLVARLEIDTLLSHLASAEDNTPQNEAQRANFAAACAQVPARRRSLANSAGIALGPDYAFDLTRPGIALYGGVPCAALAPHLRQVAWPQAAVIQLRDVPQGGKVGYNATFTAPAPMKVAILSLGYADGYLRGWSGKGSVRSGAISMPVVGRVSMDLLIVNCTHNRSIREGDWVDIDYSLCESSKISGLSQYELLTVLGKRFHRIV